jgi:hypothetical protein
VEEVTTGSKGKVPEKKPVTREDEIIIIIIIITIIEK